MLNMHEAKTHLSKHLAKLKQGDRIILCRRNRPVAEILPIAEPASQPRPIGLGKGLAEVPEVVLRSASRRYPRWIQRDGLLKVRRR